MRMLVNTAAEGKFTAISAKALLESTSLDKPGLPECESGAGLSKISFLPKALRAFFHRAAAATGYIALVQAVIPAKN